MKAPLVAQFWPTLGPLATVADPLVVVPVQAIRLRLPLVVDQ